MYHLSQNNIMEVTLKTAEVYQRFKEHCLAASCSFAEIFEDVDRTIPVFSPTTITIATNFEPRFAGGNRRARNVLQPASTTHLANFIYTGVLKGNMF